MLGAKQIPCERNVSNSDIAYYKQFLLEMQCFQYLLSAVRLTERCTYTAKHYQVYEIFNQSKQSYLQG